MYRVHFRVCIAVLCYSAHVGVQFVFAHDWLPTSFLLCTQISS